MPMIMEATGGGWGKEARSVWTQVAKASAITSGQPESKQAVRLLERLSFALHRKNTRAVMRRLTPAGANLSTSSRALATILADIADNP